MALLIDAGDPTEKTIFAGSATGGLWRTMDGGTTWTPLSDSSESSTIRCITQSSFDSNRIYFGVADTFGVYAGGVFQSTDGGNTFALLPSTFAHPTLGRSIAIEHSKSDPDTIYLGTSSGLWRTQDNGTTWTQVFANTYFQDLITFSDGGVMAGFSQGGIQYSATGNLGSFSALSDPLIPTVTARIELTELPSNNDVIHTAFLSGNTLLAIIKSTDRGLSWSSIPSLPNTISGFQGGSNFVLGIASSDDSKLTLGGVKLYGTTNGGGSWAVLQAGHADSHSFAAFTLSDRFLVGSDGGVRRHKWSNLNSPTSLNVGYRTTQFYTGGYAPFDTLTATGGPKATVIGGTQDNGSFRVDTGGSYSLLQGDGFSSDVNQQDPSLAYTSTQFGPIYGISNFDSTMPGYAADLFAGTSIQDESMPFKLRFAMNHFDGDQVYVTSTSGMWRTTDRGNSWDEVIKAGHALNAIDVSEESNPTVWVASFGHYLQLEDAATAPLGSEVDFTLALDPVLAGSIPSGIAIHPTVDTTLFLTAVHNPGGGSPSNARVWRVTDAKTSPVCTDITGDLPTSLRVNTIQADSSDPDNILFVGTGFGLYYTLNGGTNWHKATEMPNAPIYDLRLRQSDRTLFAFTYGRGIWHLPLTGGLGQEYCSGDGLATGCPCSNPGGTGEGCANATLLGAKLEAHGSTSVSQNDLEFTASQMPVGVTAELLVGTLGTNSGMGTPFQNGLLCAGGATQRLGVITTDSSGSATWGPGLIGPQSALWMSGTTAYCQVLYRDAAGPCGGTLNTTQGLILEFKP